MSNSSQPENLSKNVGIEAQEVSSVLKDCVIDISGTGYSSDTMSYSYTGSSGTITLTGGLGAGSTGYIGATGSTGAGTYTISTLNSTDTITLTGLDASSFTFQLPEEWKDSFPAWGRVEDMCEKYPGLKIAFENFKLVYEMVKDDYDNPVPKK